MIHLIVFQFVYVRAPPPIFSVTIQLVSHHEKAYFLAFFSKSFKIYAGGRFAYSIRLCHLVWDNWDFKRVSFFTWNLFMSLGDSIDGFILVEQIMRVSLLLKF